jgi:hypothetical protein
MKLLIQCALVAGGLFWGSVACHAEDGTLKVFDDGAPKVFLDSPRGVDARFAKAASALDDLKRCGLELKPVSVQGWLSILTSR